MVDRDEMPAWLRDVARTLRDTPPPNDLWRQRLLHQVATSPPPTRARDTRRVWSLHPMTAVAAGLVCALVGAGAAVVAMRGGDAPPPVSLGAVSTSVDVPPQPNVRFSLLAPGANRVTLVGDFNGWDPAALPLRRSPDGRTWEVEIPLAPGRYVYSFVVDGALARDPSAPKAVGDDFGSPSSVVMVAGRGS